MLLFSLAGHAQNWQYIDSLSAWPNPKFMYVDTLQDRLYLGGAFEDNNGQIMSQLFYYDGYKTHNIDTLSLPRQPGRTLCMTRYKGELYVGGDFFNLGKTYTRTNSLAKMDHDTFVTVNPIQHGIGNWSIYDMVEYKGKLILGFSGDSMGGVKSRGIVSYDGSNYESLGGGVLHNDDSPSINSLSVYKDRLYAAGSFYVKIGTSFDYTTSNFQVWDEGSQQWGIVDGWKGGHFAFINEMIEYKGDLYLMGRFKTNDNAIANDIVRFDGTYFYSVGKGCGMAQIYNAVVYNDELYVCGPFREMDGMVANGLAKWNGKRWCTISKDVFLYSSQIPRLEDIAFYHDTLFVYGGFNHINSDSIKTLAKWVGDSSMTDFCASPAKQDTANYNLSVESLVSHNPNWKVFPNPAQRIITLELENLNSKKEVKVIDASGRKVIWGVVQQPISTLNLEGLNPGIYILQIEGYGSKRILVN